MRTLADMARHIILFGWTAVVLAGPACAVVTNAPDGRRPDGAGQAHDASDGAVVVDGRAVDALSATLQLTVSAFTNGTFQTSYTCNGSNGSPPVMWSGGPAAQSYAIIMTDVTANIMQWVIYDIPGATHTLPAGLSRSFIVPEIDGVHQTLSYDGLTFGYLGPCPPERHDYRFDIYALDLEALPDSGPGLSRDAARAAVLQHDLASATVMAGYPAM